jgi:hypothetical protein
MAGQTGMRIARKRLRSGTGSLTFKFDTIFLTVRLTVCRALGNRKSAA